MTRYASEDHLPQTALRIRTHDDQVRTEAAGLCDHRLADRSHRLVDSLHRRADAMPSEAARDACDAGRPLAPADHREDMDVLRAAQKRDAVCNRARRLRAAAP